MLRGSELPHVELLDFKEHSVKFPDALLNLIPGLILVFAYGCLELEILSIDLLIYLS